MNYILVADDEADIRDIYEMILKRAFPLDVVLAESGNKAIAEIKKRGKPEIIISDNRMPDGDGFALYQANKENGWNVPFVICSTDVDTIRKKFPDAHGYIEKPNIIGPVVEVVDSVVGKHKAPPKYVPIRISLLLRKGMTGFDLYMKLSESKFIKVINAGEAFIPSDAERFFGKGLQHLHITDTDADKFLKSFVQNISMVLNTTTSQSDEIAYVSLESLESVERIASALGWTEEVLDAAKHAVSLAVKAVSYEPNILRLFKQKLKDPTSKYSGHVSMLALLSCGFSHKLGWVSESTQLKLGLAALMHDLTVDESVYEDVIIWNEAAADPQIKTPEVGKYRNHPSDAANLLLSMKNVPPDIDQIILQHHENKDGRGFPRGLISSRITPLACVFIIVEDLINFLQDADNLDERVDQFLRVREGRYNSGNFKKIFDAVRETVDKSRLNS